MKKKLIAIAIFSVVLCVGCIPPRQPQQHTYTVVVPPTTPEGKKCVTECEKMMIQRKQLANQEYIASTQNLHKGDEFPLKLAETQRDFKYMDIQEEYDKCVLDCGGTKETKTEMR